MGILNFAKGAVCQFNKSNSVIDNELASRIRNLDNNKEKLSIAVSFDIAQKTILSMLHPNEGIFKNYLTIDKDRLRRIWELLIIYSVVMYKDNNKDIDKSVINNFASLVLGLDLKKLDMLFGSFSSKDSDEQLRVLYMLLCQQIDNNHDFSDRFGLFADFFVDIFNSLYKV